MSFKIQEMDPFLALTVGAKFKGEENESHQKLFNKKKTKAAPMSMAFLDEKGESGSLVGELQSGMNAVMTPAPPAVLCISSPNRIHSRNDSTESDDRSEKPEASQDTPLKKMSYKKMKTIWRKHHLQVSGTEIPSPIQHFSELVRPPLRTPHHVVDNLFLRDHKLPTPVQCQAISTLIHRQDLLACAPTGSGKTIAFLVPMFTLLKEPNRLTGVRALIVTPTMELAIQIEREAFFLARGKRWRSVQHGQTTKDKDYLVSTPGRVVTLLEQKLIDLKNVEYIVFDEGDRLWDTKSDFFSITDKILAACTKPDKVISLFTATLSEKVEEAARSVMNNPVRLIVEGRKNANPNVKQRLLFCGNELGKIVAMRNLIKEGIKAPVLIFVQSIERSKDLYDEINSAGLHMQVMNARMSTGERENMILQFRLGKIWVLVTTELLSRGIDFKNVNTVINFDFPSSAESYIHRIGRTGRAGKSGEAITFITIEDRERLPPIVRVMKESGAEVEDWLLDIKVDRSTQRRLARTTPQRMIVSTRKRMRIAQKRNDRERQREKKEKEHVEEEEEEAPKKRLKKKARHAEGEA